MYDHTSMPLSLRMSFGARAANSADRRPSKRSGGSTTWSSTLTRTRSSRRMSRLLCQKLTSASVYGGLTSRVMDVDQHIDALDEAGTQLATAAETAGLDAPVPTCPEWKVRDL